MRIYTKAAAVRYGPRGVRVNSVHPGYMPPMLNATNDQFGAGDERGFIGRREQHPIGNLERLAQPAQRGQRDLVGALAGIMTPPTRRTGGDRRSWGSIE